MIKAVFLLCFASWCISAQSVELTLVTTKGFVAFTVDDNWPIVAMQTKPPVAVAAFQIPNSSDAGTNESTNVSVSLFQLDSPKGKAALKTMGKAYGDATPIVGSFDGWIVYHQQARQGDMGYSICDATKKSRMWWLVCASLGRTCPRIPPTMTRKWTIRFGLC